MNSSSVNAPSRVPYQRKLRYVDAAMQRPLLVAMITLEVALAVALTWLAYRHLNGLIEENLYRVHLAPTGPNLARLAEEGLVMLAWFAGINVFALMLAEGVWSRRENLLLQDFFSLIEKTRTLDFSADLPANQSHEVLRLAFAWRVRERARFAAIRDQVTMLAADVLAESSPDDLRGVVEGLRKQLS